MSQPLRILIVEDSIPDVVLLEAELRRQEIAFQSCQVHGRKAFQEALKSFGPDVVLADYALPGFNGLEALKIWREHTAELPFISVSGSIGDENVMQLIQAGATDFVSKERLSRLGPAIQRALREAAERAEKLETEKLLRNSESRFRAIFHGAGTGIAVEDLNGRIVEANRALQLMLGYTAGELQQITRKDFTHARDHREETQHIKRLISGESDFYQVEKRFVRKDGRIIWGRLTVSMVRDASGQPQFPIAMIEDITERQRAEEALLQYAAIVESSTDAIISTTFDGVIFSWNPAAERLYGYSAAEANGRSISMTLLPEKEEEFFARLEQVRRGERIEAFETTRLRRDQSMVEVSITTSPIKDASGKVIGVSSIARDITERKRAEQALRESEENYRRLVELAPDAILIQADDRYVYLNSAGLELFGTTDPSQIIGKSSFDVTHPDYHEALRQRLAELSQGNGVPLLEEKLIRLDGSVVDVEVTAIPFAYRGKPAIQVVVRNITERKRAEEALRKSQASLARAQRIAHLGNWERDLETNHLTWSDETYRIFGFEPQQVEVTYEAFLARVHPEDRELVRRASEETLRSCASHSIDHRIVLPNGEIKTVNEQAEVVSDESGKPIRFVGTVLDITVRKRAEVRSAAFARLGERLSSATTDVEAARIIVEVANNLLGWDACSLDICHAGHRTVTSILVMDLIDGRKVDVAPRYRNEAPGPLLRRILESGAELIIRKPPFKSSAEFTQFGDKSRPSASLIFVPVRNGAKVIGVLSIQSYTPNAYTGEDLQTLQALADHCGGALERIRAEAENQKLAAFPQFNPNPVLELSAEGEVNYFNDAALQMAKSLGKQHPSEFLPQETREIVRQCLATGESSLRHEIVMDSRTISSSFFPIGAIGVVHCYVADITDRQNLEAQLRQSQKMESVGQLAGGIAHDFNNILTVIQGHGSLLGMVEHLPKEAQDSAQQIILAAERAANLTKQLLTFSRRQVIQPKELDLNEVISNMTKMLRRLLGEDITLQVNYAPSLPQVHADPGMMEQILLNLAVNARDAMPKGGRLLIYSSAMTLDQGQALRHPGARAGEYVCVTVKDTGTGIAPEHVPKIFDPFFTTKDVGKGTGLGLATVYGIVQQHKGWITVDSTVGKETIFQIFLPGSVSKAASSLAGPAVETRVQGGAETVLVVEDETPLRVLVRNVLERYGYRVLEAVSGPAALSVWQEHKDEISLLLTDMVMPHGITGRELAERLLADKPKLKVIYSSGYSLAVVGADMVLQEGLNFLQKPYHPRKLAQAVRDCLDEGR
ncbi:PAS domain S-box protein [Pedosphaera parvula]|nr:PAS domain S-box protein [Pedosphaera parvula]